MFVRRGHFEKGLMGLRTGGTTTWYEWPPLPSSPRTIPIHPHLGFFIQIWAWLLNNPFNYIRILLPKSCCLIIYPTFINADYWRNDFRRCIYIRIAGLSIPLWVFHLARCQSATSDPNWPGLPPQPRPSINPVRTTSTSTTSIRRAPGRWGGGAGHQSQHHVHQERARSAHQHQSQHQVEHQVHRTSTRSIRSSTLTSFPSPPTSIPAALCKATTARHTEKSPDSPSKL